jgi:parvulin-like peptidyl-prolyl isomerase
MALLKIVSSYFRFLALVVLAAPLAAQAPATAPESPRDAAAEEGFVVAALVGQERVFAYEVRQAVARAVGRRQMSEAARAALHTKALEQLIDQRLIVEFAKQRNQVTEAQLQQKWNQVAATLAAQETTIAEYLQRAKRSEVEFRHSLWYALAWDALLDHYLTEANLAKHFEQHRREFDGTRLRLAQIFFPRKPDSTKEEIQSTQSYAAQIREQIVRGQLTFEEAARQYSQAPSAQQGGEIGWIQRDRPMPEAFTRAAFALDTQQVSEPVVTGLGVHLIKLLEVKPGGSDWRGYRLELEQAVGQYLFRWTADQQRPHSQIEIVAEGT